MSTYDFEGENPTDSDDTDREPIHADTRALSLRADGGHHEAIEATTADYFRERASELEETVPQIEHDEARCLAARARDDLDRVATMLSVTLDTNGGTNE